MATVNPPLVVVVGQTGSGKSAAAHHLAKAIDGEIISADSRAIYKGMNIGTAKPTTTQQTEVKYHLIDINEPDQQVTAAQFKDLANKVIDQIRRRKKIPIMVGGSGLYVDSVLYDFSFLPKSSKALRDKLQKFDQPQLISYAKEKGLEVPVEALKNPRHLTRLLETSAGKATKRSLGPDILVVGLQPSRSELRSNITKRLDNMHRHGLKREAIELIDKYGTEAPGLNAIGYREWADYLASSKSANQVKAAILSNTLNFAKRQRTWFKRNPDIKWFDNEQTLYKYLIQQLSQNLPTSDTIFISNE